MNTECGPTSANGPDAGSADQAGTASTEQCGEVKSESGLLSDVVKTEVSDDMEAKKHVADTVTASISAVESMSDTGVAEAGKQDGSDVKSEEAVLKEEDDVMDNDEQNADGKQSAPYWNYNWPKVCEWNNNICPHSMQPSWLINELLLFLLQRLLTFLAPQFLRSPAWYGWDGVDF